MKIYVMRHGQTDWNVMKKIQGTTDIELNENGIAQANEAKKEFEKFNIDLIFCSPLKRTKKTAEIINRDKKVPIIFDDKIVERKFGKYEGIDLQNYKKLVFEEYWNYNKNSKEGNIEPVVDICNRVWNFLDELKENYQGKNVLLVTHGGTAKVINAYFNGIDENGNLPSVGFKNCEIREYDAK